MSRTAHRLLGCALTLVFATALHAQNPAPAPAAAPDLSDPEVAHVAVTANSIDIDMAKFAQTRTRNAALKQFAATMITDHTAVNAQAAALAAKLGVTPADNAVSQSLEGGAKQARTSLEALHGAAFDRAYMDRKVDAHRYVLGVIDQTLVPNARSKVLRRVLADMRKLVEQHLTRVQQIQTTLAK